MPLRRNVPAGAVTTLETTSFFARLRLAPGVGDSRTVLEYAAQTLEMKEEQLRVSSLGRGASVYRVEPRTGYETEFAAAVHRLSAATERMAQRVAMEICTAVPELCEHAAILEAITDRLDARNFDLACRYESSVSETLWVKERGIVRLAVKNGPGGRTIVFDLLHELGHVESGEPSIHHRVDDPDYRREQVRRENAAWALAEKALMEFGLGQHRDDFLRRRDQCLATYGIGRNLPTPVPPVL